MIKCPNCEKSHYVEHYSTTTALGWVQEYKNGELVNSNPNVSTTYCTCCECGHDFFYTEQYGKVQEIVDKGKRQEVPTLKMPINVLSGGEVLTVSSKDMTVKPSTNIWKTMATNEEIEEINKKLDRLTKMVESLWEWNTHDEID